MKHSEGYFKGQRDANIYYQNWLPDGSVKAVLLVLHGIGEHSGRYINAAEYFVSRGYGVYALDHFGHGKSDGTRVYVERFSDYTAPLRTYTRMIHDQHPGKPLFLVAHSMGALISSVFLIENQGGIDGAVFTAAGVRIPENITPMTIMMARILSVVMPKAGAAQLEYEYISRDHNIVNAFYKDPLVYTGKTTARLGTESLSMMKLVEEKTARISVPLLILHGGEDKMVALEAAQMLEAKVSSHDKALKIYAGHYHDLLRDTGYETVLSDVHEWLELHL